MKTKTARVIGIFLMAVLLVAAFGALFVTANAATAVSYIDLYYDEARGELVKSNKTVTDYTAVTSETTSMSNGFYVVTGNVTISTRIEVTGVVHLILADGATLNATKGIHVRGTNVEAEDNYLYIYGQSESEKTMGKLIATAERNNAGIGSNQYDTCFGKITINGGNVSASGGVDGAGIGHGYGSNRNGVITINGGIVNATGGTNSAGIGSSRQTSVKLIQINGGTVTATGYVGIGSSSYHANIVITGGNITATGTYGVGIGCGDNCGTYRGAIYRDRVGSVLITGGTVTATGRRNPGIGVGEGSVTINNRKYISSMGSVVILTPNVTSTVNGTGASLGSNADGSVEGMIYYEGDTLVVKGQVMLPVDHTVKEGVTLHITAGAMLIVPEGVTLTNNGGIQNEGTIQADGTYVNNTGITCTEHYFYECKCFCGIAEHQSASFSYSDDGICPNGCYQPAVLKDGAYEIASAGNLFWLGQQLHSGSVTKFSAKLTADITLPEGAAWTPINVPESTGDYSTFDGNGYFIDLGEQTGGLFERFNYGTVKNLTLYGSVNADGGNAAAVIGSAYRTRIVNVVSYVDVSNPMGNAGGLAGYFGGKHDDSQDLESKIVNCAVYADITGSNAGGLIAESWNGTQYYDITGCIYIGNVTGANAGAIVGYQNTDSNICTFTNVFWLEDDDLGFYGKRDTENQRYNNTEAKTLLQFASGEVAYLLGSAWGQNLSDENKDAFPVFNNGSNTVYQIENTGCAVGYDAYVYSNDESTVYAPAHTEGTAATCTAPAVCSACQNEYGEALGHDMSEATCTAPATCKRNCGRTEGAALGHAWRYQAEGNTIAATCDNNCGTDGGSINISAVGKTYDGTPVNATLTGSIEGVTVSADDITYSGNTSAGTYTASITVEGATATVEFTVTAKAITVTTNVQTVTEGNDLDATKFSQEGALDGHSVTVTMTKDNGKVSASAAVIKDENGADVTDNYDVTYTNTGIYHEFANAWSNDGTYHLHKCLVNGCIEFADKDACVVSVANCTTKATCSICEYEYGEVDADNHDFGDYISNENATCTTDGTKTKTCSRCSSTDTVTDVGSMLGHDMGEATCTAPATCKRNCGHTEGEALGHDFADADCTTPKTCEACGETDGEALGHDMGEATCTVPATCKRNCGHTEGEALGHSYDNACDGDCNVCGTARTPAEHVDADENNVCDECNAELPKDGLSGGAIAGIVIGSVAVVGIGGFSLFWFVIKKKRWSDLVGIFKK